MRVALLTREYPPDVYGGAGVHVEDPAASCRGWRTSRSTSGGEAGAGDGRAKVVGHEAWEALEGSEPHMAALRAVSIDLTMGAGAADAEVVHSHTWYANFGGHLAKLLYGIPHVATAHGLEPLRPWKAEQLGGGYALSMFCEQTAIENADAVIAVSRGMGDDILACYPAVDPGRVHKSTTASIRRSTHPIRGRTCWSATASTPGRPSVVFVGRITRQKGVEHLLEAAGWFDPAAQLVLCAGAPDTPELGA